MIIIITLLIIEQPLYVGFGFFESWYVLAFRFRQIVPIRTRQYCRIIPKIIDPHLLVHFDTVRDQKQKKFLQVGKSKNGNWAFSNIGFRKKIFTKKIARAGPAIILNLHRINFFKLLA
jgi:hypothetical protein